MNNCNCNQLLPLILGYFAGTNSNNCWNCDQGVMPINNNGCNGNSCWLILLLLLACGGCGSNNGCCNCNG